MSRDNIFTEDENGDPCRPYGIARPEHEIREMQREAAEKRNSEFRELWALRSRVQAGEKLLSKEKARLDRLEYKWG